jgi:hypothetical protein
MVPVCLSLLVKKLLLLCRNLAIALRSLALVSQLIPSLRQSLETLPTITEKQAATIARNFDSAAKDYSDHLGRSS